MDRPVKRRVPGKKLAENLGISFYDKNILRMNSDESGIKESYFHLEDEKAGNRLLYKIINTWTPEKGAPSLGAVQHIIRAAADDDAGFLRRQLPDHFRLEAKQIVG